MSSSKGPTGLKTASSAATLSRRAAGWWFGFRSSLGTRRARSSRRFDRPVKIGGWAATVTTSTSLNLRALLKTAVARSGLDAGARVVSGLTASANALFVAAAAHARPKGAVLYVVPTDGDLEQAVGDTRFFLAALEGLSDAAAHQAVLPFPSHEVDPY